MVRCSPEILSIFQILRIDPLLRSVDVSMYELTSFDHAMISHSANDGMLNADAAIEIKICLMFIAKYIYV